MKVILLITVATAVMSFPVVAIAQHGDGHSHGHRPDLEEGALAHWLPLLEESGRAEWQKPDHVAELLNLTKGMTVADIGAGTGFFLGSLSAAVGPGGRVLGLDIDEGLVGHMNQRAAKEGWNNVSSMLISSDDPGLSESPVDRILIVNTWHHISGRESYSRKLNAGLKSGGTVYVVDFTEESPHGPPVEHRLPSSVVIEELTAGGLEADLVTDEDLPYQYVVVGRRGHFPQGRRLPDPSPAALEENAPSGDAERRTRRPGSIFTLVGRSTG